MANLLVSAVIGRDRSVDLVIPTQEVLSTSLHISDRLRQVPTLISVENVNSRLASLGLVLRDERQLDVIARTINKRFLAVPIAEWRDVSLKVATEQLLPDYQPLLGAVNAVREPTLAGARRILDAELQGDIVRRRQDEDVLVGDVTSAVRASRSVWQSGLKTALSIVGRTVLSTLTTSLIGVPLADVIHQALGGVSRRI